MLRKLYSQDKNKNKDWKQFEDSCREVSQHLQTVHLCICLPAMRYFDVRSGNNGFKLLLWQQMLILSADGSEHVFLFQGQSRSKQ